MAEETCAYKAPVYSLNAGRRCDQPPLPGDPDGFCILHCTNPTKDADAFRRALAQKTGFNFSGFVFPMEVSFSHRDLQGADFANAQFLKSVNLRGARFGGWTSFHRASFVAEADFREAGFHGEANFVGARFGAEAHFERASFAAGALFAGVTFRALANFWEARFAAGVSFLSATFGGHSTFRSVAFGAGADFANAKFDAKADFVLASFVSGANFASARFADEADFTVGRFGGRPSFERASFAAKADFGVASFPVETVFHQTIFGPGSSFAGADAGRLTFRNLSLANVSFRDAVGLEKAEFDNVQWDTDRLRLGGWQLPEKLPGPLSWLQDKLHVLEPRRGVIQDELDARAWKDPHKRKDACDAAARVYRGLIRSYRERGDYEPTRHFDYNRMEMRRLAGWEPILTAYGALSGYGLRWGLPVLWFLLVWLTFGLVYASSGLRIDSTTVIPALDWWRFLTSLVGPCTTFLTAGLLSALAGALTPPALSISVVFWWQLVVSLWETFEPLRAGLLFSLQTATFQRPTWAGPVDDVGRWAQGVESILGPFLLGLLGLALRRKFQR